MKITTLIELPELPVTHDPNLKKKVMIKAGEVPHVTNFSQARIPVQGLVSLHRHEDMWEVFFVSSGEGKITIAGKEYLLNAGTCILVEPKEEHSLVNTGNDDLLLTYFGVV